MAIRGYILKKQFFFDTKRNMDEEYTSDFFWHMDRNLINTNSQSMKHALDMNRTIHLVGCKNLYQLKNMRKPNILLQSAEHIHYN